MRLTNRQLSHSQRFKTGIAGDQEFVSKSILSIQETEDVSHKVLRNASSFSSFDLSKLRISDGM
jgi:hypothetical protein